MTPGKLITNNKKAYFNYEILDTWEAGIVLKGHEVKSVKTGQINIRDAFVRIENGEAWLWNADITKYKYATLDKYDSTRSRKLLLSRKEIDTIAGKQKQAGLTLLALKIYLSRGKVKVEVGLGRGKKQHEKKEKLKERQENRDLHRDKRKYMVK